MSQLPQDFFSKFESKFPPQKGKSTSGDLLEKDLRRLLTTESLISQLANQYPAVLGLLTSKPVETYNALKAEGALEVYTMQSISFGTMFASAQSIQEHEYAHAIEDYFQRHQSKFPFVQKKLAATLAKSHFRRWTSWPPLGSQQKSNIAIQCYGFDNVGDRKLLWCIEGLVEVTDSKSKTGYTLDFRGEPMVKALKIDERRLTQLEDYAKTVHAQGQVVVASTTKILSLDDL